LNKNSVGRSNEQQGGFDEVANSAALESDIEKRISPLTKPVSNVKSSKIRSKHEKSSRRARLRDEYEMRQSVRNSPWQRSQLQLNQADYVEMTGNPYL
jgi:hypothetical protein